MSKRPASKRTDLTCDPLRDVTVGNKALAVGNVIEAIQYFRIRAEPLHAEWDDNRRATVVPSPLYEGTDSLLGLLAFLMPVFAQGLDLDASKREAIPYCTCALVDVDDPRLVLQVIAWSMCKDENILALRITAESPRTVCKNGAHFRG